MNRCALRRGVVVFKSAVDWWFYAVLAVSAFVILFAAIPVVQTGSSSGLMILFFAVGLGLGLPIWLLLSTHYTVTESELIIKSGPFSWRIERALIQYVTRSASLLSSPALSLKRLEIGYGDGQRILISPAQQDAFVEALSMELRP
ncbi:MAG: PH domain-containing protein [bacterium]